MMNRNPFWRDKCVIITGASSGIGWALAEHLATRHARLGLLARRGAVLEELAAKLRTDGTSVAAAVADVCDPEQTRAAIARLEQALGPCDVLIASAGIHRYTPGDGFDVANANAVVTTNVQGVINAIGAVLPGMLARRRGRVVGIASIAGMLGLPQVAAYSASKAAVVTLMESLRVDLARYGLKVTTICPGFVNTPMIRGHWPKLLLFLLQPPEAARRITRAIERGRAEYWFPRPLWLVARLARTLPHGVYRRLVTRLVRTAGSPRRTSW
jgi:short-subunit dehydrogenase